MPCDQCGLTQLRSDVMKKKKKTTGLTSRNCGVAILWDTLFARRQLDERQQTRCAPLMLHPSHHTPVPIFNNEDDAHPL